MSWTKRAAPLLLLSCLWIPAALAQGPGGGMSGGGPSGGPGPSPNPWIINGPTLSYNNGGLTLPATVVGGSKGAGTLNVSNGYYVAGNKLANFYSVDPSLTLSSGVLSINLANANGWTATQTFDSTATRGGVNLSPGATPSGPSNGDMWTTASGLFVRIAGATVGPLTGPSAGAFAATSPITVSFPSSIVTYACPTCAISATPSGAALTKVDDTNVTLTLGGAPATALLNATSITVGWSGTLAAARLNANVVQGVTNDTNVTGSVATQTLTLGWTGTLAAGRLNANVVQSVVNDTNVTGSISAQALTLGWTGRLAFSRLTQGSALSVIGVTGNAGADLASIAGTANQVLRVNGAGTALAFGSIDLSQSAAVGSSILALANGGLNAALTASIGGVFYSTASAGAILSGTATANLPLLSGSSAAPSWAAVSHPASATSGGVAYFSSTSVMASSALLAANQIVLGGGAGTAPATLGSLGTATTLLHGNASGAPAFSAVVSADLNITTTSCTNQFVSAISAGAVGTCTTTTLASAQFANQGTTTTVLHGNAAGNPSFTAVTGSDMTNNTVTYAKIQTVAALSVLGNCTNATADVAANAGTANQVMRVNGAGTSCGFGAIDLSQSAAATGVLQAASFPAMTGDVTTSAGALASTIAANAVTYAKFQTVAAVSLVGNPTGSLATSQGITLGSTLGFSGTTLNCTTATGAQIGCSRPDGTTITISGGVLTAVGGSATAVTIGTTSIISGTTTRVLYDNAGVIGEVALTAGTGITLSGTANATIGLATIADLRLMANFSGSTAAPTETAISSTPIFVLVKTKQVFTADGTYTPSTGMKYAILECLGSAGGGGGATSAVTHIGGGGGGGAGSYSRSIVSAATVGASQAVTVGNAGTGGAAGNNNGTAGSDVSVGSLCIGKGGSGGSGASDQLGGAGGLGGVAGTGEFTATGNSGAGGSGASIASVQLRAGAGGASIFGGGGGTNGGNGNSSANGVVGGLYGGGGSGGYSYNGTGDAAGGNGGKGVVIITEFTNQ